MSDDPQDLTKDQERRLSEGVQLQFAAETLFKQLTSLPVSPPIALGALAVVAGEFLFRMHSDPRRRAPNRMAFDAAVRNTLAALEAVEQEGVQGATRGLARLQANERPAEQDNVVPIGKVRT